MLAVLSVTTGQRAGYAVFAAVGLLIVLRWRRAGRAVYSMLEYLNAPRPQDRAGWHERGGGANLPIAQALVLLLGVAMLVGGLYATLFWNGD